MKGTGRIILGIFGCCSLFMIYVHLQVVTFLTSYEIHRTSEQIYKSSEELRKLRFEVERYKAPHLLEGRIKEYSMNLALPEMVYRVPRSFAPAGNGAVEFSNNTQPRGVPQFLRQALQSWIQVAHAKNDTSQA